jgi:hypothetical protein
LKPSAEDKLFRFSQISAQPAYKHESDVAYLRLPKVAAFAASPDLRLPKMKLAAVVTMAVAAFAASPAEAQACTLRKPLPGLLPALDVPSRLLSHPGGVMSHAQIERLWRLSSSRAGAVKNITDSFLRSANASYEPKPFRDMYIDWQDSVRNNASQLASFKPRHDALIGDGEMVYRNALAFQITCNPAYAQRAFYIVTRWADTVEFFSGRNAVLETGWAFAAMARGLELLKYTYTGYDATAEEKFLSMVRLVEPLWNNPNIFGYMNLDNFSRPGITGAFFVFIQYACEGNLINVSFLISPFFSPSAGNWMLTIGEARAAIGFLRRRAKEVDFTFEFWKRIIDGRQGVFFELNRLESDRYLEAWSGQITETCRYLGKKSCFMLRCFSNSDTSAIDRSHRDIVHAQFSIGGFIQVRS